MTTAALAYLSAPAFLFLVSFVKPALGWPLALGLLLLLWHIAARSREEAGTGRVWMLALAAAVPVLALMGFGTGHFNWDWIKHWALLNTLEAEPWPAQPMLQGQPAYLRFYLGAYLVPAGLAHATGWGIAPCTALWYGLGLTLGFTLLSHHVAPQGRLRTLLIIPLLLTMAGADAWLQTLLRPPDSPIGFTGFHHEWWANALLDHPLQYSSPLTMLLWVPHQAVPAFIGVGLINSLRRPIDVGPTLLATSLLALWAPYVLIGASLLLAAQILARSELRGALWRPDPAGWCSALFAIGFVALMAWTLTHQLPRGGLCLDCAPARLAQPGPYLLFLAAELVIPLIVLRQRLFDDVPSIVALAMLAILPWIGGAVPDAVMRISMPCLIYLFARSAAHILRHDSRKALFIGALVLAISGPTVWGEVSFHVEGGARHAALPTKDPLAAPYYVVWASRTTYTVTEFFDRCGWIWRPQYFSSSPPPTWPALPALP